MEAKSYQAGVAHTLMFFIGTLLWTLGIDWISPGVSWFTVGLGDQTYQWKFDSGTRLVLGIVLVIFGLYLCSRLVVTLVSIIVSKLAK